MSADILGTVDRWIDIATARGQRDMIPHLWTVRDVVVGLHPGVERVTAALSCLDGMRQSLERDGLRDRLRAYLAGSGPG